MTNRNKSNILSFQTLLTLIIISVGVVVMVTVCVISLQAPCINNFYTQLPTYPDAEQVAITSSSLNYLGVGDLSATYETADARADVELWYRQQVDDARSAAIRAQAAGETVLPVWRHDYIITEIDNSDRIQIMLVADCLN